ncbi:MAG: hypothetical protein DWQ06_09905 [Calditrichaeota bacterium]|nr:MAG: hypothetical protein DWQ06_09905 [Calditrichota bacterium]
MKLNNNPNFQNAIKIVNSSFQDAQNKLKSSPTEAIEIINKTLGLAESENDEIGIVKGLTLLGIAYYEKNEYEEALNFSEKALAKAEETGYKKGKGRALLRIGSIYDKLGRYNDSLCNYFRAIRVFRRVKEDKDFLRTFGNIGNCYYNLGAYDKSLKISFKGLKFAEKINDEYFQAHFLINLGIEYQRFVKNSKKADEFYLKAIETSKRIKNNYLLSLAYENYGTNHLGLGNYEEALNAIESSIELKRQSGNLRDIGLSYLNFAAIFYYLKNFKDAEIYYQRALEIFKKIKFQLGISHSYYGLGITNRKFKKFRLAFNNFKKSLKIAEEIGAKIDIQNNSNELYELYLERKNYKSALKYFSLFQEVKEDIFTEKKALQISELTTKYETEIFKLKNLQLTKLNERLKKLNQEKNEILSIAAHDLKNPLTVVATTSSLVKYLSENSAPSIVKHMETIETTAIRMREIITKLLDVNAIESGKLNLTLKMVSISNTIDFVVNDYKKPARRKDINIFWENFENVDVFADKTALHEILDNLISNAVKYTPYGKNIFVRLTKRPRSIVCEIQDEGLGISEEDKKMLFQRYQKLSARPTGGESSTGLGLSIVKKLVEEMNGIVTCESKDGYGSLFTIELPSEPNYKF